MNENRVKYILDKELNFVEVNVDDGYNRLRTRMNSARQKRYNISGIMKFVACVLLIILVPVTSAYAYEYYKSVYRVMDIDNSLITDDEMPENGVVVVDGVTIGAMENLQMEWEGQKVDRNGVVLKFRLSTKDGSPLIIDEINKVPVFTPLSFENMAVSVNGENWNFAGNRVPNTFIREDNYIGCTMVANDYSYADFELSVHNENIQQVDNVSIKFENLIGTYHIFEDLKTQGTLGDILAESAEGEKLHITFSDEFPECYIDSYDFMDDSVYDNPEKILHIYPHGKKLFTMTVVCNEESKEAMRNLVFQNTHTGLNGIAELQVKELSDGRLRFYYSVNYDGSYVKETNAIYGGEPRDTTRADLEKLTLKLNGKQVTETLMQGTIEKTIIIE